ncbi:Dystroglycan [Chionoecetes opilio]|uniref:Dystroglycan n=1 Tax=Chionoecetes opilio TaxID=41210 RepID=A0A8J4Y8F3_CHIOP|nr:Dystroglycan [Chionoecetes opilio]
MRLLTSNLAPIPSDSWLQFDSANHEFFGIPLTDNAGKTEYNLECVDNGGKKVIDALFVNVLRRPSKGLPAAQFSITLQSNFREFMRDAHLKARLVERIATVFGDTDSRHVAVDAMTQGSVVVTWHNASLPADPCPEKEVMRLRQVMMDDDGQLLSTFIEGFAPDYRVVDGRLIPAGVCLGGDTPTHIEEEQHQPPVEDTIEGDNNDYLINFIIPAVIIAAMLLLAAVIACCLYRRRRYGKMTMADDRTFVSKGIPIIFAEELDDRPDPAKSPVIMKEEKPPLPPPEYQRGSSPANTATPPSTNRRRPHSGVEERGDDAPSYQPPPPFTATNGASRNPRPNMPPTYRKPPTYVPP